MLSLAKTSGARGEREELGEIDRASSGKDVNAELRGTDLPCRDGGTMEGHEQVDLKVDTITSDLCRVSLRVGRSIS